MRSVSMELSLLDVSGPRTRTASMSRSATSGGADREARAGAAGGGRLLQTRADACCRIGRQCLKEVRPCLPMPNC